jgi:hypothetical protein
MARYTKEEAPKAGPTSMTSRENKVVMAVVIKEEAPLFTFDRWFASKGFKSHWKAGMAAFADISGRKTAAEWDLVFKAY